MKGRSGSRTQILGRVRAALDVVGEQAHRQAAADKRLSARQANLIPARGQLPLPERVALFAEKAVAADATVDRVADPAAVPAAIADYLRRSNRPLRIRRAPDPELDRYPWAKEPLLAVEAGKAESTDETSVTGALCGIAETGTLMLESGETRPTTLNFLPETHIVVLHASQVVASYEDGWVLLRGQGASRSGREMPRTVNFITGPSRSADIEQTLQLGAHGPRQLHIVIVGEP